MVFFCSQFFESDVSSDKARSQFMRKCPEEDQCCFSLREYMDIEFWGRECSKACRMRCSR